jgi:hypothetical protein
LRRLIRGFQGLLVSFRAFFCPARHFFWLPGILGEVASQCLYLAAKPPMWGVDVDGLAYLSGAVLSCHCNRRWRLLEDVELPGRR